MSVRLPDIEWFCRFQCMEKSGMERIVCTSVTAMDVASAYKKGAAGLEKIGYTIIGSTVTPASGKLLPESETKFLPWDGGTVAAATPPQSTAVPLHRAKFPPEYFKEWDDRPTVKQLTLGGTL